ncbi:DUF2238 domain-containing protein [Paenibacillus sp. GCM10023248]|uniref:DUF2238 domain-containing protein n=1 Tax=Bacillales TaxID=1385 RepID=UPI0023786650|nr:MULTISPECIES: DUF2238 domain-containing protein [Bacillales]MDD9266658.1 DUF2238 domain-containing protein [Paenibacillus sp. MAHUQ-63]MDR6883603.1 putative membrane protein [Bacillus sp. 3255]
MVKQLQVMLFIFAVYWAVLAISPTNRIQWLMENLLLVAAVTLLLCTYRRFQFSMISYWFIFVFLCFHAYGAHYTYQGTPFDAWLKGTFHTHRSYYDRVVHFLFGLFWTYPAREWLTRVTAVRKGIWSYVLPVTIVFGFSSLFEIIEMIAALVAGQAGQEYVGMQGDPFDSEKDMGLGLAGAALSMCILGWKRHREPAAD